ncbi:two-component response regulator-like APRR5 [Humulus lupulus]|uniref:two-component response regulator-like APRR5 n=1 Tax=Humulus lupulus TaxID=3486 RepID=UPI002B41032B|nr:two-component response regulator-like APRR5 [Humulus lupulus]
MGEVVLSSSEDWAVKGDSEVERRRKRKIEEMDNNINNDDDGVVETKMIGGCSSGGAITSWDRFLPRMMMRVLLVEADDSTRQIITALLRKCSYKVAAVSDGLKAWELLKGRPHNIDLILTEVDLPSISGFPLLTLVMEHDICKNIPIIMMSSQDSISTVYKCMMRGAADYLVKPIRRNELSNLWQHVWRRKSSSANGPRYEGVAQNKGEATSENDPATNHSNGYIPSIQRNEENIDKGSDSQSSCTRPELEVENVHVDQMQECSQPTRGESSPSDSRTQKSEGHINAGQRFMHGNEVRGSMLGTYQDADAKITPGKGFKPESIRRDAIMSSEACENNKFLFNRSRDTIDLNGVLEENANCNYQNSSSSNGTSKFDSGPKLDLTLRSSSGDFESHMVEKRHTLGHSNASAFTRYINKPLQTANPTSVGVCDQEKECGSNTEKHMFNFAAGLSFNSDTPGRSVSTPKSGITLATGQSNHSEAATHSPQQRLFPLPIPVKGIRVNNPVAGYGSVVPSVFCSQSGSSSLVSPSSAAQQEPSFLINAFYQTAPEKNKSEQSNELCRNNSIAKDQSLHNQEHKLDFFEDRGHISPTTDQSASSSFCNGNASHLNSIGYGSACGSNSNVDQVAMIRTASENRNDESYFNNGGNSHRSMQREAALTKFRMKRKDRCFEKKVRYESRKKLAEQRPRVKGQFVRQAQTDPSPAETEGNS